MIDHSAPSNNRPQRALVYEQRPEGFYPKAEIGATYVDFQGRFLLLELAPRKTEAGSWGVPAGKIEPHETPAGCSRRELFEETVIDIASDHLFEPIGPLYIRKPEIDYVFHLFWLSLDTMPCIQLSDEHQAHKWVTREEAETLNLMKAAKEALDFCYRHLHTLSE
jgi:8-oxo-dGTP diphosphatase